MVSFFSSGGGQEMTVFFFERKPDLNKEKSDKTPSPANNFLLVFIFCGIDSISFIEMIKLFSELNFQGAHKIHKIPYINRLRDFFLKGWHISAAFLYFIKK